MIIRPQIKNSFLFSSLFLAAGLLGIAFFPHITHALEVHYPDSIPGLNTNPNDLLQTKDLTIGALFQFLFLLAVWLIGLLAFGSLLVFGFIWETSTTNPAKKLAAKLHFQGTLVGIAMLLGFTIILRAVNPDLASLANRTFNFCGSSDCSTIKVIAPITSASLTYTIDIKNTSIKPSVAETYTKAFEDVPIFQNSLPSCYNSPGCDPTNPDPFTKEFFANNVDTPASKQDATHRSVVQDAINNGVNPVFAVAVWLTGTKMTINSTRGINSFGCTGKLGNPDNNQYSDNVYDPNEQPMPFRDSENCFFAYVKQYGQDGAAVGFEKWISNYCRASVANTLCGNTAYASFTRDLQENYDHFFSATDTMQPSQPLNPPINKPVK